MTVTLTVRVSDSGGNETVATQSFQVGGETVVTGFQPSGFTVPEGETWRIQGLVETPANVVVYGTLKMRAGDTLRFVNVAEAAFVGSGNDVLASDVGLWVMGPSGVLDAQGTPKVAWNRTGSDPSWLPGDVLKITPTAPGDYFCSNYTGGPVPQAYPDVPPAEVFNLTRDCRIEGTPGGRAHIFIISPQVQLVKYVEISHMGPRKNNDVIVGRWALHFHHAHEGSRGTVVEGVSVHDVGSFAFVPHESSGITFRSCIAYKGHGAGFWWDDNEETTDAVWEDCLAAEIVRPDSGGEARASGFFMHSQAPGGVARRCVVAAISDGTEARGFAWTMPSSQHWVFEDCVAHNCKVGLRWWANNSREGTSPPRTDRLTAYNCKNWGIFQGAYRHPARHDEATLRGNPLEWHAAGDFTVPAGQTSGATNTDIDIAGLFPHALIISGSNLNQSAPHTFIGCRFDGATVSAVQTDVNATRRDIDFVRCLVGGQDLEFADFTRSANRQPLTVQDWLIRVQRVDGTAFSFGPTGNPTDIPPFG